MADLLKPNTMKLYYVIKAISDESYVSILYVNGFSKYINDAIDFESKQDALQYAERNFYKHFIFTIEEIYKINK